MRNWYYQQNELDSHNTVPLTYSTTVYVFPYKKPNPE